MIAKALYSSRSEEWQTPPEVYDALDREFNFTLDAAASAENAKAPFYYDKQADALKHSWKREDGGAVFVNPPYGKQIRKWVRKAYEESLKGQTVVMLIHALTDTAWFHDWVYYKAEIRFLRSRLCFLNEFGEKQSRAPFPSMIVVYRGRERQEEENV